MVDQNVRYSTIPVSRLRMPPSGYVVIKFQADRCPAVTGVRAAPMGIYSAVVHLRVPHRSNSARNAERPVARASPGCAACRLGRTLLAPSHRLTLCRASAEGLSD